MSEHVILHVELDRDFIPRHRHNQDICTRLVLQTSDALCTRFPKNECAVLLLLDSSSSMNEAFSPALGAMTKREGVSLAAQAMIRELQPTDRISVAFFDSRAYLVADSLLGTQQSDIVSAVQQIERYTGSTNFEAAFLVAQSWMQHSVSSAHSRRLVFLTDGNETTGRWAAALQLAKTLSEQGITIDCLGVGGDFAFERMREMSEPSGGTTHLLESPTQATQCFREILHNAQRTLVHDVLMRFRLPPERRNVEIYQVVPEIRYHQPVPDPTGWTHHTVRIGDLYHHQIASLLVHFSVDTQTSDSAIELFQCRLDYSIPLLGLGTASHEENVHVNLSDQVNREIRDTSVSVEYIEASLMRDEFEFRQHHQTDWQKAVKILEQMFHKAQKVGLTDKANAYQSCREQLMREHRLSQEQLNRLMARTSRSTRAKVKPQRQQSQKPVF